MQAGILDQEAKRVGGDEPGGIANVVFLQAGGHQNAGDC